MVCFQMVTHKLITLTMLLAVDGGKQVPEAAFKNNCWEITAFHQLVCKGLGGTLLVDLDVLLLFLSFLKIP